jgi:hypothetical protein
LIFSFAGFAVSLSQLSLVEHLRWSTKNFICEKNREVILKLPQTVFSTSLYARDKSDMLGEEKNRKFPIPRQTCKMIE